MAEISGLNATVPKLSRADQISDEIRRAIRGGEIGAGQRLPGEFELSRIHAASRPVIREAIATLRAEQLVEVRKGVGVFALNPADLPSTDDDRAFRDLTSDSLSSVIELMELRMACEVAAAAHAARRRSPSNLEAIHKAHLAFMACLRDGRSAREADYNFHLAICEATQNSRFPEFLHAIRESITERGAHIRSAMTPDSESFNGRVEREHLRILDAIGEGNDRLARKAMTEHLQNSLTRYQQVLRAAAD